MSCLLSAMLTSAVFTGPQAVSLASVIDPAATSRAMNAVFQNAPLGDWRAVARDFASPSAPIVFTAAVQTAQPPIPPEKLKRLVDRINQNTDVIAMGEIFSDVLGLTHPFIRKNTVHAAGDVTRGLSVGVSDPTRLVFYIKNAAGMHMYACTLQGELVSAAVAANKVVSPLILHTARAGFEAELRFWSTVTIPDHVPTPPSNS